MKDKFGREYAKLSDLKVGDTVQVDDGFTCIAPNAKRKVLADSCNQLYIRCGGGEDYYDDTKSCPQVHSHMLDAQLDLEKGEYLIGVYKL